MHIPVGVGYITIRAKSLSNTFGGPGIRTLNGQPRRHDGWDIACFVGSPVYAVLDGAVVFAEKSGDYGGYGRVVILKVAHEGNTYYLLYAHLKSVSVAVGDVVKEGQVVGRSGQTGSTAEKQHHSVAHLHFEVRRSLSGSAIDPGILLGYGAIGEILNAEIKAALMEGLKGL